MQQWWAPMWAAFRCNIRAGLATAIFQRRSPLDFRVSVEQYLLLLTLTFLLSGIGDWLAAGNGAEFNPQSLVHEGFFDGLILLAAYVLARMLRQPHLTLAIPLIMAAVSVPVAALHLVYRIVEAVLEPPVLATAIASALLLLYQMLLFWRVAAAAGGPLLTAQGARWFAAGVWLLVATWLPMYLLQPEPIWQEAVVADQVAASDQPSVVSEEVLTAQPGLLGDAIEQIAEGRPGVADLYFVGFAPYASEDVFRKDMGVARQLFDTQFDTAGRSIELINNPQTVLERPLATISNLRQVLEAVSQRMNPEEDVVFLYLSSHGSEDHRLQVEFPPLELNSLTPTALHRMLLESGIKYKVIVVSSCYSGGFIEPLKDHNTLIMTAAQADRPSFGCSNEAEFTYFGEAYFHQALRSTRSFLAAFEQAKALILNKEKQQGYDPSNPQIDVGSGIAEKLQRLEAELASRALKPVR